MISNKNRHSIVVARKMPNYGLIFVVHHIIFSKLLANSVQPTSIGINKEAFIRKIMTNSDIAAKNIKNNLKWLQGLSIGLGLTISMK